MSGGVFISYRWDDSAGTAGRIRDRLIQKFPADKIFMDVDNIEPGLDLHKVIATQVAACDVLLAVIGRTWADARDKKGNRRLEDPNDFVRIEIEAALQRDVRVIPTLVDGGKMPDLESLPGSLRPLLRRSAVEISRAKFDTDVEWLVRKLVQIDEANAKRRAEEAAQERERAIPQTTGRAADPPKSESLDVASQSPAPVASAGEGGAFRTPGEEANAAEPRGLNREAEVADGELRGEAQVNGERRSDKADPSVQQEGDAFLAGKDLASLTREHPATQQEGDGLIVRPPPARFRWWVVGSAVVSTLGVGVSAILILTGGSQLAKCDALAAFPSDGARPFDVAGVDFENMNAASALTACRLALNESPNEPRVQFELGRALSASGAYSDALMYYRRAADRNYAAAENSIGYAYHNGEGVPKDYSQAVSWFRKAADQGNAAAQTNLGVSYEYGDGVGRDITQAVAWYKKAAAQREHIAVAALKRLGAE